MKSRIARKIDAARQNIPPLMGRKKPITSKAAIAFGRIPFVWSPTRELAAALMADDSLSIVQVAEKVACSTVSIYKWQRHPEFMARVAETRGNIAAQIAKIEIANKVHRLRAMNRRHKKLEQVIEERGADPKMEKVPGGKTGLLVRELKTIGVGKDQQIIQQFSVDGTLLKSALELETAAAKELGQLNENASASLEVTVKRIIGIEMSML